MLIAVRESAGACIASFLGIAINERMERGAIHRHTPTISSRGPQSQPSAYMDLVME